MDQVTIVIPTFNRSGKLIETLDALANQDFKNFRVMVVDDGSEDDTALRVAEKKKSAPFPLDYLLHDNSGASATTNLGVSSSGKGLIILLDDDIIPFPETIRKHVEFHKSYPNSIISGSADTDPTRTVTDVQRYKLFMETEWRKLRSDTNNLTQISFDNFIITTANMSFPSELFLELGGFDINLRDGYDVDFGFRALLKNISIYFDRNIQAVHNDQISLRYYAKRQKAYMDSKRTILAKNPELREKKLLGTELHVPFFKAIIYMLLRQKFMVRFFESGTFLKIFPKAFRYRIYGSTIAALSLHES